MPDTHRPPLILGATGRLGCAFRTLWARGLWPGAAEPLWLHRPGHKMPGNALEWGFAAPPPADYRLHMTHGIIALAGATSGDEAALAANTQAARAALRLRAIGAAGPILLMSSAAVYGRSPSPLREAAAPTPASPYGAAKAAMEAEFAGTPGTTCLRLANVAGSDALFASMAAGPVALDRFASGKGPRRSYIGPLTLARTLTALLRAPSLPPVLNLAAPGAVAMEELLTAAGADWRWTPAPETALPAVEMEVERLMALCPLPPANPTDLVEEAQAAGWPLPDEGR